MVPEISFGEVLEQPTSDASVSANVNVNVIASTFTFAFTPGRRPMSHGRKYRANRGRIVGHDAVGTELEQARRFGTVVDDPVIHAQPGAVALGDERRAVEADRSLVRRHLGGVAGE